MLALKILLLVLSLGSLYLLRISVINYDIGHAPRRNILISGSLFIAFTIAFWIAVYFTNYDYSFAAKVVFFISVCLYIAFHGSEEEGFWVIIVGAIIALFMCFIGYGNNIKYCETPTIATSTINIIGANDTFTVTGDVSGGMFYISGSIDEKLVYYYYYKNENGNIVPGHIPADSTEIVPMTNNQGVPRIEKTVTTKCYMDYNNNPPTHVITDSSTATYKLYVPVTAVTDEFIFDLN